MLMIKFLFQRYRKEELLIKATNIKIKPFWKRWLYVHNFTGGVRAVYDTRGRKRHARIYLKCGQRDYID